MGAGAESHAGIDFDHSVALPDFAFRPAGLYDHVLAQAQGLEALLPVLCPVLLGEGLVQKLQLARVEAQIHGLDAADFALHHTHAVVEAGVHLVIAGHLHIIADALSDGLVDDVPLSLRALVGGHIVFILNHGAETACVHQYLGYHVRAGSGRQHRKLHPIHSQPHVYADMRWKQTPPHIL